MTRQKSNLSALAVHLCASDSTSVRPEISGRPFESSEITSPMAPSSRFLLVHQCPVTRSPLSARRGRGRMLSVTASAAPVAASSFISTRRLTTAQVESGVQSPASDTMTETSNQSMERTADRCKLHFEMTPTFSLRTTRALVRRRSSCSR